MSKRRMPHSNAAHGAARTAAHDAAENTAHIAAPKPQLSIIVPVLNEARQLPALLEHLQHWHRNGCEIIVVDGGSSDGSAQALGESGFQALTAQRGRARQMNAGATLAGGELLLFLHADTRLPPQADHLVRQALSREQAVWGRFDVTLEGGHWMLPVIGWMMNRRSRLTGIATGDQAMFVAASTFNDIGGFADLPLMEDIQLSQQLCRIAAPVCLPQKATASGRRWMEKGVWRTIWLMWRLRWAFWRGAPAQRLAERYQ
jgi:rSAM/selenodomain-associated transferase 2